MLVRPSVYQCMGTLLLAAMAARPARAGELPLTAVYGTPLACELFASGGTNAVFAATGPSGSVEIPADDGYLLVSKSDVVGLEWGCHPDSNTLGKVTLSCSGEGDEWTVEANIIVEGDTLSFTDDDRSVELHPCPTDKNATM